MGNISLETGKLIQLGWPLALASLINMAISITDVVMTGWLGQTALAATAAASDLYSIIYYVALGIIAALSPIIGQALGAGKRRTVRHACQQAFWAVALLCLPGTLLIWHSDLVLSLLRVKAAIITTGRPYAQMMAITFCFMLLSMVWHYLLSAHKRTRVIFRTTLVILPLNAVLNYLLMFGHLGLPPLGLAGIGLSSALCATTTFVIYTVYVLQSPELRRYRLARGLLRPRPDTLATLFRIGIPIGVINLAELGVFLFSTLLMGTISVEVLAAHTVAIRMAGVIYALPLGLAQATAIRTAFSAGAGDRAALQTIFHSALRLAMLIGLGYLLLLGLFGEHIARLFLNAGSSSAATLQQAGLFLLILALCQPFACVGAAAGGVLRGLKDTRMPMLITLTAYWGLGFGTALLLAFVLGGGGTGIWIALALAESLVGMLLMLRIRWLRASPESAFAQC